jgi:tetratricopeptide (TPR) repeat protein
VRHPARACLAEVIVQDREGRQSRGSGYRVAPGWVLTAAHVVTDAARIALWLGIPARLSPDDGIGVNVSGIRFLPDLDLALVPLPGSVAAPADYIAPLFGQLDRDSDRQVPAVACGCPWFKLRPLPGADDVREVLYAKALIVGGSNLKTGTIAFPVTDTVPAEHPEPGRSPWEGMSGAAVFADSGHLIGVVGAHHPREGLNSLTVRPLVLPRDYSEMGRADALFGWRDVLSQVRQGSLPVVHQTESGAVAAGRAWWVAHTLAPGLLVGRQDELAWLSEFALDEDRCWLWLEGDAFAGKTSLLAWFSLYPPEDNDVVSCFMRVAGSNNTAGRVLDVVNRQLAELAGRNDYSPAAAPEDLTFDLEALLTAAAAATRQRNRRILVVLDGLDEYSQTDDWPPDSWLPATLPPGVSVVVSSRSGLSANVPDGHPLRRHMRTLPPSRVAQEVQRLAKKELKTADPAGLLSQILACLAACGGSINLSDLHVWPGRRGRQLREYLPDDLRMTVQHSLHRSIRTIQNAEDPAEWRLTFSHASLLDAAETMFAASLPLLRHELFGWAQEHAQRAWPPDTPAYLLVDYPALLARLQDHGKLLFLALDQRRHDRLLIRTGTYRQAFDEIRIVQSLLSREEIQDLGTLGSLALRRDSLKNLAMNTPDALPALWARLGQPERARALTVGMSSAGNAERHLTALLAALLENQEFVVAHAVAADIEDAERRATALAEVAEAAGRNGDPGFAEPILAEAEQAILALPGSRARALVALARGAAAIGDDPRARRLLEDAAAIVTEPGSSRGYYFGPDPATVATVVAGFIVVGALRDAETLARHIPDRGSEKVKVPSLIDLARAWIDQNAPDDGVRLAEQAERIVESTYYGVDRAPALAHVAEIYAAAGQHDRADTVAGRAVQYARIDPRTPGEVRLLAEIGAILSRLGKQGDATELFSAARRSAQALDPQHQYLALIDIAEGLLSGGRSGEAITAADLAAQAASPYPARARPIPLTAIGEVMRRAGATQRARRLAEEAGSLALVSPKPDPAQTSLPFVRALLAAGHTAPAERLANGFKDFRNKAVGLANVACAVVAAGDRDHGARLAHAARQAAEAGIQSLDNRSLNNRDFADVAEALVVVGEFDSAESLAAAFPAGFPTDGMASWVLSALAGALARRGEHQRALNVIRDIKDVYPRAAAQLTLVHALVGAGDYSGARRIATRIRDEQRKAEALVAIAPALARIGQYERAQKLLESTEEHHRVLGLVAVASAITENGDRALAKRLLKTAGEVQPTISNEFWAIRCLADRSAAYAMIGEPEGASRLAEEAVHRASCVDLWSLRGELLTAAACTFIKLSAWGRVNQLGDDLVAAAKTDRSGAAAPALADMAEAFARHEPLRQLCRRLVAQAWLTGSWEIPLMAVARMEPDVLTQFLPAEYRPDTAT